ncbi:MAG: TonB-dependent receptor plug domain-containing protein [Flammeovirgaceae bacterium]|nr:TonB-dependent receptor plug domain-containing protein [Flammeovirgaceae bacterium]
MDKGYGNLLYSIQGLIPGLLVRQVKIKGETDRWVVYTSRGATSSISNSNEVLVMVDNVPLGGSVEQILLGINPDIVESIEFTNRINVLYGSQGASGVISIYTKQASNENYVAKV